MEVIFGSLNRMPMQQGKITFSLVGAHVFHQNLN